VWEDLVKIWHIWLTSSKRSLRDPAQVLNRKCCGDPVKTPLWKVLAWSRVGPCQNILRKSGSNFASKVFAWRSCRCHVLDVLVWKLFCVGDIFKGFLCQDLVRPSPATGPCMTILWISLRDPGMKILVKIFHTSLWEDFVGIRATCCQRLLCDFVQAVVTSSWRGPGEILPNRTSH